MWLSILRNTSIAAAVIGFAAVAGPGIVLTLSRLGLLEPPIRHSSEEIVRDDAPLPDEPSTVKEFVERIEANGMRAEFMEVPGIVIDVRLHNRNHDNGMMVWIESEVPKRDSLNFENTATIVRFETAREAKKECYRIRGSSNSSAFTHGRFLVFSGDDRLLDEIKRHL
jgi:hypothetical protein